MSDDYEWGPWIEHDDSGWPEGVEPDEVVIARLPGCTLSPMPASGISWRCPGDPVERYRRRIWKASKLDVEAPAEVTA